MKIVKKHFKTIRVIRRKIRVLKTKITKVSHKKASKITKIIKRYTQNITKIMNKVHHIRSTIHTNKVTLRKITSVKSKLVKPVFTC
jgi:septal ring factor EnvC (AmiA/AmiB activator)